MTARFLTANLVGLYPSSSPATIPAVILPTARTRILQSGRNSSESNVVPRSQLLGAVPADHEAKSAPRIKNELEIAPQSEIQLPQDHRDTESCICSYCTLEARPSKIPVLSRAEYEMAELQSQCEAKDQHVSELLKTVQSLQGQVNVLNAKLLFLHDHHTTRPMRRRTLTRSNPATPAHHGQNLNSTRTNSNNNSNNNTWQSSLPPLIENQSSTHVATRTDSSMTTSTLSSQNSNWSNGMFAEGIQATNNSDGHHLGRQSRTMGGFQNQELFQEHGQLDLLRGLGDDDSMSFLELEGQSQLYLPQNQDQKQSYSQQRQRQRHHTGPSIPVLPGGRDIMQGRGVGRDPQYETELESVLRDMEEVEEEPEREGEDLLDAYYYMDAYKTMDQQLYRRPILPMAAPPRPMSADQYKKHHRLSLPIQTLMSRKISIRNSFRWKSKAVAA